MANEVALTSSMLDPRTVRLSWAPFNNSAYEIWMWASVPTGSDWGKIATISGPDSNWTYDVVVNWSTHYAFMVRGISAAGAPLTWSNIVTLFCACGYGYVFVGAPPEVPVPPGVPPTYFWPKYWWQQSVDINNDVVALSPLSVSFFGGGDYRYVLLCKVYDLNVPVLPCETEWHGLFMRYTRFNDVPVGIRIQGQKIVLFNPTYVDPTPPNTGWQFTHYNGTAKGPDLFFPAYTGQSAWLEGYDTRNNITYNSSGRVCLLMSEYYYSGLGDPVEAGYYIQLAISHNDGNSFDPPILLIASEDAWEQVFALGLAETSDGTLWIVMFHEYSQPGIPRVKIYKYTEGGALILQREIVPTSGYPTQVFVSAYIYAEGNKIVVTYTDVVGGLERSVCCVSNDNGENWTDNVISYSGASRYSFPAIAISNGKIIAFVADYLGSMKLLKSTDDGASWALVKNLDSYYVSSGGYPVLRSDGEDVVYANCGFKEVEITDSIAYLISHDEGSTWDIVKAPGDIIVPM